jgi:hypothetical protein
VSNITIDQLGEAITAQLNTFETSVREGVKKAVDKTMTEMVKETQANAQERPGGGRYKKSIGAVVGENTLMRYSKVWRVKAPHYRLAHLLDKGHATRNGGRYSGNAHVANAERHAVEAFQRRLEEVIRDAGSQD